MKTLIVGCTNSGKLARKIAGLLNCEYLDLEVKHFPDGEIYLRFLKNVSGKRVVLVQSMHPNPNESMLETIFAANTARELGAKEIVVAAPYLAYMRQDKRFRPGECVSNKIMSKLLSFDEIITIDPHLHRIKRLGDIFQIKNRRLSANNILARYIAKNHKSAIIVGPDIESYQWAQKIAESVHMHAIVLRKKRYAAEVVRIKVKTDIPLKGKDVVIVDDIISTGHTMIEPIKQLKKLGVRKIYCICIHGVFAGNALKMLQKLGAKVVSTNTIENPVSKIDISELIAKALR